MSDIFNRTAVLLGNDGMEKLKNAHVAVFGIGGVGSYIAEALARSGVGTLELIDSDVVSETNINRQLIALTTTIGKPKTELMCERILSINPEAKVFIRNCFFLPENAHEFDFSKYTYVADAVDTISAKTEIILKAKEACVPVISAMGAGNKLDPTKFEVTDIFKTSMCPLAKAMRQQMKKHGIKKLKVVYSPEPPVSPRLIASETKGNTNRPSPGSVAFVPSVMGLIMAGEIIKDISGE